MKFLFASDSFKGTLFSDQIISILEKEAKAIFPDCRCGGVPVADGGEGTMEAVVKAMNGQMKMATVHGPLMEPAEAFYGVFGDDQAVIEMAALGVKFLDSAGRELRQCWI